MQVIICGAGQVGLEEIGEAGKLFEFPVHLDLSNAPPAPASAGAFLADADRW